MRFRASCGYRTSWVHFGLARFLAAIPTEDAENGVGGEAKCVLREHIGFAVFSAGSTLGLRAPDCAKESKVEAALPPLWTLFTLRRGCLSAYTRRHPGTRKDPPESNLCSGGSCCITMISIRSIVQTRAALKRRRVGLRARSGVEAGTAGRVAAREAKRKRHSRRVARTKRSGCGHCPPISWRFERLS